MGKVIILDENTSNKIAAGEVIERPASVVKELVENSIDAGATNISIEIKNGGITFIKITDNGSGIEADDLEIAFERHSTSKIRGAEELFNITTLGFRGEALASIAAVSSIEVTTRTANDIQGSYIKVQGGTVKDVRQTGCPVGTTFTVKELFYNTPARFKFLKKDNTETRYVADIIERIALANPHISLKLVSKASTIIHTPGNNDLKSTIFSIYGRETANGISQINYRDDKVKITGYAGKPEIARSNRSRQSIYVNGRYVKSKLISSAIDEAYKTMMMKNKYPFIVINIEVNPMVVDVNVHPTKMEVRFTGEQDIFRSIYYAVNSALLNNNHIRESGLLKDRNAFKNKSFTGVNNSYVQQGFEETNILRNQKVLDELSIKESGITNATHTKDYPLDLKKNEQKFSFKQDSLEGQNDVKVYGIGERDSRAKVKELLKTTHEKGSNNLKLSDLSKENYIDNDIKNEIDEEDYINEDKENVSVKLSEALIIGQAFSTYIILQMKDILYFVDQHAAHERLLYESLKQKVNSGETPGQMLISPVVIELTQKEIGTIVESQEIFESLGFTYENFGNNSVLLRSIPFSDKYMKVKEGFLEVLDSVTGAGNKDFNVIADDALYNMACKAAIKANKKLSEPEIKGLLCELDKLENPFTCPHGRPTVIKMTKYEMEKLFKRIV